MSTNDVKLALVYGEEAVVGETFTITVSCVAISDLIIHEIVTLIWSVRDFKYKLLERAILVTNLTVSTGWSLRRTIVVEVPTNADLLLIELFVNYTKVSQMTLNYEVTVVIRDKSYSELAKEVNDLKSKVANLSSQLSELRSELERVKANYLVASGNYSELKCAYKDLKVMYDKLLEKYEDKSAELERLKATHETLALKYDKLLKKYDELKAKCNNTRNAYLNYKSKYEELLRVYEELIEEREMLVQRLMLLSNIALVLGICLTVVIVYVNRERVKSLLRRRK